MSTTSDSLVRAVYELREAAVEHGRALAAAEAAPTAEHRDALLETQIDLERKTVSAVDECGGDD
jgi:hypothetical protein